MTDPTDAMRSERSTSLHIRTAQRQDATAMARILNEIIAIGGTTVHCQPFDERRIADVFLSPKFGISCFVALEGVRLVGFQALEWCDPDWPGENRLPADWAIISTYVEPRMHKRGVGRAMFAKTAEAARQAGVRFIDATIRRENTAGQAFYQGLGFMNYRSDAETVSKRFAPA